MAVSEKHESSTLEKLTEVGQIRLLEHLKSLSEADQKLLIEDLKQFNFDDVKHMYDLSRNTKEKDDTITPFGEIFSVSKLSEEEKANLRCAGLDMMGQGNGGMILLAGGQGTRLQFNRPKGCYSVKLPSNKSLFEIQSDRLQRMRQIVADHSSKNVADIHIPWYIMTSMATDKDTKDFFEENNFFGLPKEDIFFFSQDYLPSLTVEGEVILETSTKCAKNPNGNGGIYSALLRSGALEDMKNRGVQYVQVYSVDNILIRMADPYWFGHMVTSEVDCTNKVCRKRDAHEKVGVMCLRNECPSVVEYSEISTEMAEMVNDEGQLVYGCGNIAMHGFSVNFLNSVYDQTLPIHVAKKRIPCFTSTEEDGRVAGIKLELFIFDTFAFAKKMTGFEAKRSEEFSPVKNTVDKPKDNATTARTDFSDLCKLVSKEEGFAVPEELTMEINSREWYLGMEKMPRQFTTQFCVEHSTEKN